MTFYSPISEKQSTVSRKVINWKQHAEMHSDCIRLFTFFRVSFGCTTVTAVHEDNIVEHIEEQTCDPNNEDKQSFLCLLRIDVPLDSLDEDAEHQSDSKNGVAEGSQHICPGEAKGVCLVPSDAAEPHPKQADDHRDEVGENCKGI